MRSRWKAAEPLVVVISHWVKGGVGGLDRNLERWTGQPWVGGSRIHNRKFETLQHSGLTITLLNGAGDHQAMNGTITPGARLLAAYIESPGARFQGVYTAKLQGAAAPKWIPTWTPSATCSWTSKH